MTIVKIKTKNYFFNEDKFLDLNVFFKFYKNYEEILTALNKSFFYFYIEDDFLMRAVKEQCVLFEDIIVKEIYGSIFYLLMRDDLNFLKNFEDHMKMNNYLINDFEEEFDKFSLNFREVMTEAIRKD